MSNTCNWTGASGKSYEYYVKDLPWRPDVNQKGNYIFAKIVNGRWQPIYIGQGDLQNRYDAALQEGCVNNKGATHYHVHTNTLELDRKNEERDLIGGYPDCKWPTGCNGKN